MGVPGTLGFFAEELLVEGATETFPLFGVLVAATAALNGITVFRVYGALFCGAPAGPRQASLRSRERAAVLALAAALLAAGFWPWPLLRREEAAAVLLLAARDRTSVPDPEGGTPDRPPGR